ncbi:SPOR domain-containing protein [Phaeobacter porticola]|uniref:Sporulation related protein domain protein n=1 Tax=Phaeobacter porticola TaxID=1844006 RepID=A0A1L3I3E7_9RHOB|nr:SPOR domain-containing protein [Phaeobacter porticola]APG46619.1 Sporulation related protein domain protein [Phaeobacter porticola]
MTLTRIIASALIAVAGISSANAQSIRTTEPPAEFPPASYAGKQYVDSRGCVFIRAGIDGNTTWVPRVTRSRKQLCGFEPTEVSATSVPPKPTSAPAPELITLPEAQQVTGTQAEIAGGTSVDSVPIAAAPRSVTTTKPQRSAVRQAKPRRVATSSPSQPRQRRVLDDAYRPSVQPVASSLGAGRCVGASALSQQYINQTADVRCGPQGGGIGNLPVLDQNTRVLPKHVYQERQLARGIEVPQGYRHAWDDDRLNPRRAEMSLGAVLAQTNGGVPRGYVQVTRQDRYNPNRGPQGAAIWTRTVPRDGIQRPVDRPILRLSNSQTRSAAAAPVLTEEDMLVTRLSTRSAPTETISTALAKPVLSARRYVRAGTFADRAKAEAVAQRLRQKGMPIRLGRVVRNGQSLRVVLAGPFATDGAARAALSKVKAAGFGGARLSK